MACPVPVRTACGRPGPDALKVSAQCRVENEGEAWPRRPRFATVAQGLPGFGERMGWPVCLPGWCAVLVWQSCPGRCTLYRVSRDGHPPSGSRGSV